MLILTIERQCSRRASNTRDLARRGWAVVEDGLAGEQQVARVLCLRPLGGPVAEDPVYGRHRGRSPIGANAFVHQPLSYLPGEYGGILSFVLFDFVHHNRCGHFRLRAADNGGRMMVMGMMRMMVAMMVVLLLLLTLV